MLLEKRTAKANLAFAYATGEAVATVAEFPSSSHRLLTTRFGTIEIDDEIVITLPEGLIGFEACRQFIVIQDESPSAFRWLQSLDEPSVAFPVVEPNDIRPDYAPTVSDADAKLLELAADTPTLVFAIVTIPKHNPRGMTANLLGPLVVNAFTRVGKQCIVQDEEYGTRHLIVDELKRSAQIAAELQAKAA
jgi:flagellar assembly factor FliW